MAAKDAVSLADIRRAREVVARVALRTPVLPLKGGDRPETHVKCENLQRGGAFKCRGAYNLVASLGEASRRRGVVAYSSGNHAQGVALAARLLGVRATVVMLDQSLPVKVEGTRAHGAEVVFGGRTSLETRRRAERIAAETGAEIVPPFDDPRIIAGQGTVGLEILEQLPDVRSIVVQVGGGGLIAGIATAVKESRPEVKVFGVEPAGAPKMHESLRRGELATLERTDTVADGLKPLRAGEHTFAAVRRYVDDLVLVTDDEILEATRHLIQVEKLVAEPSGAAALAAVRAAKLRLPDGPAAVVISGGNVDLKAVLGLA